jgi:hypothetical protein
MEGKCSCYSLAWLVRTTLSAQTVQQVIIDTVAEDWTKEKHGILKRKMNGHTCGTKIRLSEQINVFTVTLLAKQLYAGVFSISVRV